MGRSESKQAYQDSSAMAKQNQAAAAAASAKEDQAIGDYRNSIGDFQRFTENEFRPGGQYTQDQDVLATSANAGGQNSTEDYYRNAANRMNLTALR